MKVILKYLILCLFAWSGITGDTDCSELFKIPELVNHYHQEVESGKCDNFISFFLAHYFDKNAKDNIEDHSDLPFHNHYDGQHSVFDYPERIEIKHAAIHLDEENYLIYLPSKIKEPIDSFFVPPKYLNV